MAWAVASGGYPSVFGGADIERVAQTVTEKIQREQRAREDDAGENDEPWVFLNAFGAVIDERPPGTERWLDTEPEEAEKRFKQHHARYDESGVNDDDAKDVRDD